MDVPTPIDSRLNVDGRLSESPLPTYDGVPVSSSLSRYVVGCWWEGEVGAGVGGRCVGGEGGFQTRPYGRLLGPGREPRPGGSHPHPSPLPSRERGESPLAPPPSGYLPRIGVRGRLFAGMTDGSRERGKEGPPSQSSPQMGEEARRGWGNRSGGDGFPPRIGVRGRLFAGMTDGSRERGKEGPPSQSSPQMGEEARRGWGNRSGGDGFPPRIGVRGRLFAGMTDGGRPYGGTEGRERGWVPAFAGTTIGEPPLGSRPVSGTGQAFRGKDGWGVWLNVGHACWGGEGGAAPGWGA